RAERHAADLERNYLETEAVHRHVKDRLCVLWDEARERAAELKAKAVLQPATLPDRLSEAETGELRQLLTDLSRLWHHPAVTSQQRKTIVRLLVKDVVVAPGACELAVTIH